MLSWPLVGFGRSAFAASYRLRSSPLARSAAPRVERRAAAAAVAAATDAVVDERLLGAWRYAGGAYEIANSDGRLIFKEHVTGELKQEGEWLVAELPTAGTIRLKLTAEGDQTEVLSEFKSIGNETWGEPITAVSEWQTLEKRTEMLEKALLSMKFEGSVAGGSVVVTVDGNQRPLGLKLAPNASQSPDLGKLIVEAHDQASEASLDAMTERLRELYAGHFSAQAL